MEMIVKEKEIKAIDDRILHCIVENPNNDFLMVEEQRYYVRLTFDYVEKSMGNVENPKTRKGRQEFESKDKGDLFLQIENFMRKKHETFYLP